MLVLVFYMYKTADNLCLADIAQMYKFILSASV